ncbi:S41 family peptidase [Catalinimonas niigatensis]|uniref:S41 family peptidase n=1 Tax=Catalinimonas niigatensis TaxID=1397264 RepID=UPI002666DC87|nr:S41 family peptidase [Catalinimonas niigatensis]WPP53466.1 S41 family peptidase [Catalinimonas niigatensis]
MRDYTRLLSLIFLLPIFSYAQKGDVYFAAHPTISPDGQSIVFSYEGDLWRLDEGQKLAMRLTGMEGEETHPYISPNGQWIAFTGSQYGSEDIFLTPIDGGEIQQLTFHEASDEVDSWSWDSQHIYFTSDRENSFSAYKVNVNGGTPQRLFGNYFNTVHDVVEHPSSGELFFNETWESARFASRKGYKGAYSPDIKSYNPSTGEFKKYTDYEGKEMWTTISQDGKVFFVSTEANGEYNLYQLQEDGSQQPLTDYNSSVMHPQVSANGEKIVFVKDYQLHVYHANDGSTEKLSFSVPRNLTLNKAQDFNVKDKISYFDVSSDNKKLAFVSRGELFVSDVKGKYVKQLETNPMGRVSEVSWLKDDKNLIFSQTVNGYQNWFTMAADGSGTVKELTSDTQNNRQMSLNTDKTKAVYLSGRNEIKLMDLENFSSQTLAEDEIWGFYSSTPYFSPDDQYVVYTAYRDFEQDIFVHDLNSGESTNITSTGVSEVQPFWSPDGKSLFLSTDRTNPGYPFGTKDAHIYRMHFDRYEKPYRSDKFDELFKEEDKEEDDEGKDKKKNNKDKDEAEDDEKEKVKVEINFEDLMKRLDQVSTSVGEQSDPYVIQKDEKLIVFYISNHDKGKNSLWKTTIEPFEDDKTEKIEGLENVYGFGIAKAEDNYYLWADDKIHTLDPEAGKVEAIDISYQFSRKLEDEFEQMYYELWANLEENFYNEDFHGIDWQAMRDKYAAFLPYINSRSDLRHLTDNLLGELNSSHLGFYSNGEEEKAYYDFNTLATGIQFSEDNPYEVTHIVKNSPADVKGKDIQPGDRLTRVNGEAIDTTKNREYYFTKPSGKDEVLLTFQRRGKAHEVKLHPTSYYAIRTNLYDEWIEENQQYVNEKADERIAYVHMKNMGMGSYEAFAEEMVAEADEREALILDLRYNTGGNVHDMVLNFLSRKPYLQWKYRGGTATSQPNFAPAAKPIVLLVNEQSLSDAEMTAAGFKALGLGTIIGTETYRWIIFTSGKGLVDGSFYRLPSWGCYTLDGKNLEKEGVKPDIHVAQTFKDRLDNKQPQLDRAIEEIMSQLNVQGK